MRVHDTESLTLSGSVVAIGAFDGVHRGHQTVIREMVRKSHLEGVPSVVYTFDPPPRAYSQGAQILTSSDEKIQRLKNLGVDHVIMAKFDENYMKRSAGDFIRELHMIHPRAVMVGNDFRFGNKRAGDVSLLKEHFTVQPVRPVCCPDGERISSTRIRELMMQGKQDQALPLLGWM
ncbi:FAD synthetase [Siminovitchia sediminis]|uniref:FAD synthase n=1 Tax=Siminovitchia sediminis TaxID=1274353 RepID=A0ABW4KKT4_9BACI